MVRDLAPQRMDLVARVAVAEKSRLQNRFQELARVGSLAFCNLVWRSAGDHLSSFMSTFRA